MSGNNTESEIGSFFRSNLLAVRKAISQQDFKKFSGLQTNDQKVAFVLSYPEAHQLPLIVENHMVKDSKAALQLKDIGNKFFSHGEFAKALETYSNAVLLAPLSGTYN